MAGAKTDSSARWQRVKISPTYVSNVLFNPLDSHRRNAALNERSPEVPVRKHKTPMNQNKTAEWSYHLPSPKNDRAKGYLPTAIGHPMTFQRKSRVDREHSYFSHREIFEVFPRNNRERKDDAETYTLSPWTRRAISDVETKWHLSSEEVKARDRQKLLVFPVRRRPKPNQLFLCPHISGETTEEGSSSPRTLTNFLTTLKTGEVSQTVWRRLCALVESACTTNCKIKYYLEEYLKCITGQCDFFINLVVSTYLWMKNTKHITNCKIYDLLSLVERMKLLSMNRTSLDSILLRVIVQLEGSTTELPAVTSASPRPGGNLMAQPSEETSKKLPQTSSEVARKEKRLSFSNSPPTALSEASSSGSVNVDSSHRCHNPAERVTEETDSVSRDKQAVALKSTDSPVSVSIIPAAFSYASPFAINASPRVGSVTTATAPTAAADGHVPSLASMLKPTGNRVVQRLGLPFKTAANQRFHLLYADSVPDVRENHKTALRYSFLGEHSSIFNGTMDPRKLGV